MSEDVKRIYRYLDEKNVKHSNLGYRYLMDAIEIIIENPSQNQKMNGVYEKVAEMHSTTSICVERAIRHTISQKNQTSKEFISKASDDIRYSNCM